MWKIKVDHTLEQARDFLLNDFLKVAKRTRYLYVESKCPNDIGPGYFEPVLLILCWCDFLGALYTGNGSREGSTERSKIYIREVMGNINQKYKQSAKYMVKNYRNGAVHAYAPGGNFHISINDNNTHLDQEHNPHLIKICVNTLIDDFIKSVEFFAKNLSEDDKEESKGCINSFNKARQELLDYESEEPNNKLQPTVKSGD